MVKGTFLLFDDHKVKTFLRYLNSKHRNMKFTFEEEENDSLSFLDVKITRENGKFSTSVFRKKTFSGVYSNFDSFLPVEYKKGLIATLLYRAFTICSNYRKLHDEITRPKVIWQKNNFPLHFVDRCVKKVLDKLVVNKKSDKEISLKREMVVSLVFIGKQSL